MAKKQNTQLCAILSYLLIGIIWYFVDDNMQKDAFVKFHVKQGIILIIFSIIWSLVLNLFFGVFMLGFIFMFGILHLLSYVPLVFAILGILNAVNGKKSELPIIGKYAKKLTF